jgi:hypothetical protein
MAFHAPGLATVNPYTLPPLTGQHVDHLHEASLVGGYDIAHYYTIAAGVAADHDFVLTYKTLITRAQVILLGAGVVASTVQIQTDAAADITDEIATSAAQHVIVNSGLLHHDNAVIAAGGTVRIACGGGGGCPDILVIIYGVRVL